MSRFPPRVRALAAAACLSLLVAACGDDDEDESTASEQPAADVEGNAGEQAAADSEFQEYCDFAEGLDSQEGPPTDEQMAQIKQLRPEAIGSDVDLVADAFVAADGDFEAVFSDPAVEEALTRVEEWEDANCPGGPGDVEVAAEHAEYCALVQELDNRPGAPTEEELLTLKELRPDEIGADADAVIDAAIAADLDFEAAFADPEVSAALDRWMDFDAETCGI